MSLYGIDFLNEKSDEIVSTANRRIEEIFGYRSPNGSYNEDYWNRWIATWKI